MNRGDVLLLVLYCLSIVWVGYFWEFGLPSTIVALALGGAVFAVRLWLARRTFRH